MRTLMMSLIICLVSFNSYAQSNNEYYLNITVVVKSYTGEIFYFGNNSNDYYKSPRIEQQDGTLGVVKDNKQADFANVTQIFNHFKLKGYAVDKYQVTDLHKYNEDKTPDQNSQTQGGLIVPGYHVMHILLKKEGAN